MVHLNLNLLKRLDGKCSHAVQIGVHIGPQRYSGTDHTTTSSTLTLKNAFAFDFKTIENLDRSRHEKTINVNNTALKRRPSAENGGYRIGPTWSGSDITWANSRQKSLQCNKSIVLNSLWWTRFINWNLEKRTGVIGTCEGIKEPAIEPKNVWLC